MTRGAHYTFAKDVVYKIVWQSWLEKRGEILEQLKVRSDVEKLNILGNDDSYQDKQANGTKLVCLGDARHDSPGFTACWCTYALLVRPDYLIT